MNAIRLLLVEEQACIRRGLRMRLEPEPDIEVVGEAADGETALSATREVARDVVLMDIEMPGQTGIEAARDFRDACPDCRVIILSLHDGKANKAAARAAGAFDFVCKHEPTESLLDAIRRAGERKSLAPA